MALVGGGRRLGGLSCPPIGVEVCCCCCCCCCSLAMISGGAVALSLRMNLMASRMREAEKRTMARCTAYCNTSAPKPLKRPRRPSSSSTVDRQSKKPSYLKGKYWRKGGGDVIHWKKKGSKQLRMSRVRQHFIENSKVALVYNLVCCCFFKQLLEGKNG